MTKIDIFSGFLGAGKTTLIKKLIAEAYTGEQLVLIENEFGEIGIDGGFLKNSGINITEMNSGCICCSLVGDFATALADVINKYSPDRILIEPSGVGKLSDVIKAVEGLQNENVVINSAITVADATKCKMYMKNFGEFFNNQIKYAGTVVLSRTDNMTEDSINNVLGLIREINESAAVVTTPWDKITGDKILAACEEKETLINNLKQECHHTDECEHHHEHCHEHHHEHDHEKCEHHHHEHNHNECEHHHHEHCGCSGHHHEHHHADEIFESIGIETPNKYTKEELNSILNELDNAEKYGNILRAKGFTANANENEWLHFDYVPQEKNIRLGSADVIGKICVIGADINKEAIKSLFRIQR